LLLAEPIRLQPACQALPTDFHRDSGRLGNRSGAVAVRLPYYSA
jgi:hypothetical protein